MRIGTRRYDVEWGHLALATLIAGVCLAYLLDARATSLNIQNLLLVQPTALLVVLLYVLVLPQCFKEVRTEEVQLPGQGPGADEPARVAHDESPGGLSRSVRRALLAAAFGAFILSTETIGYDVAAFLFTLVGLWICGERRPLALAIVPPVFAAVVILGFKAVVPYPMTTLVL